MRLIITLLVRNNASLSYFSLSNRLIKINAVIREYRLAETVCRLDSCTCKQRRKRISTRTGPVNYCSISLGYTSCTICTHFTSIHSLTTFSFSFCPCFTGADIVCLWGLFMYCTYWKCRPENYHRPNQEPLQENVHPFSHFLFGSAKFYNDPVNSALHENPKKGEARGEGTNHVFIR